MVLKFEGDVEPLVEKQIDFIGSVLQKKGFNDGTVIVEAVGKAGDNYMANVKRIIINEDNKTFRMIVKVAPSIEAMRMATFTAIAFNNEHVMYTEVLPKFAELQKSADIPEKDHFKFAECYGFFTEEPYELILLEDLQVSNYEMLDRFTSLSDDAVRLVLKDFAAFNSFSYVLSRQEPETYRNYVNKLQDTWSLMGQSPDIAMYFTQVEIDTIALLEKGIHKKALEGKVRQIATIATELRKRDAGSKYSVIQQGDAWTNNIMFRLKDGIPVTSILIDYQLSKENNPAADLHYFIFNCTDYETRKKHYYDWLDYYHTELDKYLSHFGLKANLVFSRDQLDISMKRYSKQGLPFAVMLAGVLLRKSEDAAKAKAAMESNDVAEITSSFSTTSLDDETQTKFRDRVIGVIDSYIEYGYL